MCLFLVRTKNILLLLDTQLLQEVEKALLTSLASCSDSACRLRSLRALLNAGLPTTVPTLLEYVEASSDADISEAAIKALRRINTQTDRQVGRYNIVYFQHRTKIIS